MIPIRRNDDEVRGSTGRILTDASVLSLLREGDERALEILMRRHGDRVLGYLTRLLDDASAAEDLTHDTFVRAFETADRCREGGALHVWLLRIARNLAVDRLRWSALRRRVHEELRRIGRRRPPEAGAAVQGEELADEVAAALGELAEPFRSVFLLREVDGLSYEEIGDVVGVSPKTVSTRLARARSFLRARLAAYLGDDT